jgi:hypothetical protein
MNVSNRVRDQLILSRQLLTTPDYQYTVPSDPILLTRDLIVSYGAAELALAAICAQLDFIPDKKSIALMDYLDSLGKTSSSECAAREIDYVTELHEVRSDLYFRSLTPDPQRWAHSKKEMLEHVAMWCQQFLDLRLFDLDPVPTVSAIPTASSSKSAISNEKLSLHIIQDPGRRRYQCFGSADIRLKSAEIMKKGKIANLSLGGCYVVKDFPIEVGDQIEMTLCVNKTSLRVTASVIHTPPVVADSNRKKHSSGMGVQFTAMSERARIRLQELIAELKITGRSAVDKRLL